MKKYTFNKVVLFISGLALFFGLWFIITLIFDKDSMIFPSPIVTIRALHEVLATGYTYKCLGYSMLRLLVGFIFGFITAFLLSVIVRDNKHLYDLLSPTMTALKSVPTAAVVFVFVVMFGSANAPVLLVWLISMPILYEAIVGGVRSVPKTAVESAKIDGSKRLGLFFKIQLPLAVPGIFIGIIASFSLSFKIEIMAEIITGYTRNGLGSLIKSVQVNDPTNMAAIFAYSFIAIILMILITFIGSFLKNKIAVKYQN